MLTIPEVNLYKLMHRILRSAVIGLLFITSFSLNACQSDEIIFDTIQPTTEKDPVQFGVPFDNVPLTKDIAMYEVNIFGFSAGQDLQGVTQRLDDIQALGVNVVWLMPIHPIGVERGIGSPYAISDFEKVNPSFGTLEDLRELVQGAHDRGMAVILDWVGNHTSWDNVWMKNSDWYTKDATGTIVSPETWTDVADLNYDNQDMREAMLKAMKYWVLEANVDGFRCDYAGGVPTDFWKTAITELRSIPNRDIIMFAESTKKELYSAGFDLTFGWDFYGELKRVFRDGTDVRGLYPVNLSDNNSTPDQTDILRFTTNHDDTAWDDTPIALFDGLRGSMAAFVVTAYMGGVPLIYSGQEVGVTEKLPFFSSNQTIIDWSRNPQLASEYASLVNFRLFSDAIKRGGIESFGNDPDVLMFKRNYEDQEVLVIVNTRNGQKEVSVPTELVNSEWQNAMENVSYPIGQTIELPAYGYLILSN